MTDALLPLEPEDEVRRLRLQQSLDAAPRKVKVPDTMPRQTEKSFQAMVQDMAGKLGWSFEYHTWRSDHSAAGFLDLVLVSMAQKRILYVECKALDKTGKPKSLTAAQQEWVEALRAAGQDVRVWSPLDWQEIERTLKGEA